MSHDHNHGAAVELEPGAGAILERGLAELLKMTEGLAFKPLVSERYPLPLADAVCGETPQPATVRADVEKRLGSDPVAALESALVLLELCECNRPTTAEFVPDDGTFLSEAFRSKRLNGWMAMLGDADAAELEAAVGARWQFKFIGGADRQAGLYALLNMLARYAFVYGRVTAGDSHALGHFIEDFTPGVIACCGKLTDLELTLSLAAMKLGVPAVVPPDYPFPLGRRAEASSPEEIAETAVVFPNIRKLIDHPAIPKLSDYLDPDSAGEEFEPAAVWGNTPESFCLLRKGAVAESGVTVTGEPSGPLGVVVTAEGEPLDAFDRRYIEARAVKPLSMMKGVRARLDEGRLVLELAAGVAPAPERIGETLIAAVGNEFPKLKKVRVEIIFDREKLAGMVDGARAEREARGKEIASATEEGVAEFVTCVGCSPFAPDHVCILTPERHPQCNRPYEMIKTGALYGYDDMSNIHHRALHAGLNSFGTCAKGDCLDAAGGEWSGVNQAAARLSGGRTARIQLHSLEEAPTTGCGCFQLIMFKTLKPRPGIAVMRRGYKGRGPDGRTWRDLHYALGGKQCPGMAGAGTNYLRSKKFLAAHGGWKNIVWVSPKIARAMGDDLPAGVEVGPEVE